MRTATLACLMATSVIAAGAGSPRAEEARLYLNLYGEPARVSGDADLHGDASESNRFNLVGAFGVDPHERVFGLNGFATFGPSRIDFGYAMWEHESEDKLDQNFYFGRTFVRAPDRYQTNQKFRHARLLYGYDFNLGKVTLGVLGGIQGIKSRLEINELPNRGCCSFSKEATLDGLTLALGFSVGYHPVESLSVHMQATVSPFDNKYLEADLTEVIAGIDWHIYSWVGLTGGYRLYHLDAVWPEDNNNSLNLKESGWFAGLSLHLRPR